MKKSLFKNRKTYKKKVNNKYKHFSNLKGGMETGEASPSYTPKHHTPTRKTPTRKTPTLKTPTKHTPQATKRQTTNRKRKVPSIVDGIVYSLPPLYRTKIDQMWKSVV